MKEKINWNLLTLFTLQSAVEILMAIFHFCDSSDIYQATKFALPLPIA